MVLEICLKEVHLECLFKKQLFIHHTIINKSNKYFFNLQISKLYTLHGYLKLTYKFSPATRNCSFEDFYFPSINIHLNYYIWTTRNVLLYNTVITVSVTKATLVSFNWFWNKNMDELWQTAFQIFNYFFLMRCNFCQ